MNTDFLTIFYVRRAFRWCFVTTLLVTSVLFGAPPVQAQTLTNPGLEGLYQTLPADPACPNLQGEIAAGWEDNTCWDNTAQVNYAADPLNPHSGESAQRIQVIKGRVQFAQPLTFTAGQLYTVRIWLRAATVMPVQILLRQAEAPYTAYTSLDVQLTTTWTQYTLRGATVAEPGYLMILTTTPGTFWVDDVELARTPFTTMLPDAAIPRTFFGMHIHRASTAWPAVQRRIGTVRLWDVDGGQWAEVNPSRALYQWAALDAHVQQARANNADLVLNLGRTPQWASARPSEASPYGPGQAAEPASDADWQAWVQAVGQRYHGRIRYWEIWNEPNDRQFYSGTPEKLVELARQAYTILKQIDPSNQIVAPSPYSVSYLDRYLALGGGDYADVIGYHFYVDGPPEVLFTSYIANVRLTLEWYGLQHKPLWNTEEGWLRPTPNGPRSISEAVAVGYVGRAYILNWASGVSRYYFYAWDNHDYMDIDLTAADSVTLTSPGVAYREVARWLIGAQMVNLIRDDHDTWTVQLIRPDGSNAYLLWNPSQVRPFSVPADWAVTRQRDLAGKVSAFTAPTSITITAAPVLLEQVDANSYMPLIRRDQ